jgi:hypothetical protein
MLGMTSNALVVMLTQLIKGQRRALGLGDEPGFLTRASCKTLRLSYAVRLARWRSSPEVRRLYAAASIVSADRIVSNIKGDAYRLVAAVDYETRQARRRAHAVPADARGGSMTSATRHRSRRGIGALGADGRASCLFQ